MDEKRKYQYKIIGVNIAYYRKRKGLTQAQLAEKCGASRTHISNIETAYNSAISLDILFSIAEVLNVHITKLFESNIGNSRKP